MGKKAKMAGLAVTENRPNVNYNTDGYTVILLVRECILAVTYF
ncbi:MAG: hypothetical protein P8X97_03740 [Candidatus Bathyarchaeota archaeon]